MWCTSRFVPRAFVVYASKIFEIVGKHNLEIHCYTDDSELYLAFCPIACEAQTHFRSSLLSL